MAQARVVEVARDVWGDWSGATSTGGPARHVWRPSMVRAPADRTAQDRHSDSSRGFAPAAARSAVAPPLSTLPSRTGAALRASLLAGAAGRSPTVCAHERQLEPRQDAGQLGGWIHDPRQLVKLSSPYSQHADYAPLLFGDPCIQQRPEVTHCDLARSQQRHRQRLVEFPHGGGDSVRDVPGAAVAGTDTGLNRAARSAAARASKVCRRRQRRTAARRNELSRERFTADRMPVLSAPVIAAIARSMAARTRVRRLSASAHRGRKIGRAMNAHQRRRRARSRRARERIRRFACRAARSARSPRAGNRRDGSSVTRARARCRRRGCLPAGRVARTTPAPARPPTIGMIRFCAPMSSSAAPGLAVRGTTVHRYAEMACSCASSVCSVLARVPRPVRASRIRRRRRSPRNRDRPVRARAHLELARGERRLEAVDRGIHQRHPNVSSSAPSGPKSARNSSPARAGTGRMNEPDSTGSPAASVRPCSASLFASHAIPFAG